MLEIFTFSIWIILSLVSADSHCPTAPPEDCFDATAALREVLDNNPNLEPWLATSIDVAFATITDPDYYNTSLSSQVLSPVTNVEEYFIYVEDLQHYAPDNRFIFSEISYFYMLVEYSPDDQLVDDPEFAQWLEDFAVAWGCFLDTLASAEKIQNFIDDPAYNFDDFVCPQWGWYTFNQFFARQIKPWKRPIDSFKDDTVIVSPADASFVGYWEISDDPDLVIKGLDASVYDYVDNETEARYFAGGVFTHSFLNVTDYHRFHTPVAGTVVDVRIIEGTVNLDSFWDDESDIINVKLADTHKWQIGQRRGLMILDNPTVGYVGLLPIGMAQVSAIALHPSIGDTLEKGDEFGYFSFGGSDIITIFGKQEGLEFNFPSEFSEIGTAFKQGTAIATFDPLGGESEPSEPSDGVDARCDDSSVNEDRDCSADGDNCDYFSWRWNFKNGKCTLLGAGGDCGNFHTKQECLHTCVCPAQRPVRHESCTLRGGQICYYDEPCCGSSDNNGILEAQTTCRCDPQQGWMCAESTCAESCVEDCYSSPNGDEDCFVGTLPAGKCCAAYEDGSVIREDGQLAPCLESS